MPEVRRSCSARRGIELRRNRVEDLLQRTAQRGQSRDQTNGDESGDQAILDRGGAGLLLRKSLKSLQHFGPPSDLRFIGQNVIGIFNRSLWITTNFGATMRYCPVTVRSPPRCGATSLRRLGRLSSAIHQLATL